jgi:hypothetical protein
MINNKKLSKYDLKHNNITDDGVDKPGVVVVRPVLQRIPALHTTTELLLLAQSRARRRC